MSDLQKMILNYQTTALGAGLGTLTYANNTGMKFPDNQQEWISFGISLLLFLLGFFAKDARTGSTPK